MLRKAWRLFLDATACGLGGHGLFTWGDTQRESYLNTITIIDQIGQFIGEHAAKKGISFGGAKYSAHQERETLATKIMPVREAASLRCSA